MKIGVVLPIVEDVETQQINSYQTVRAFALQAEQANFDSIWIFDHLLFRRPNQPTGGIWEAWTMATALAEATRRVEIGTLVLCTAFRNPALLAKMASTLDEVSNGRLILGLGAGWHQPEFDAFGIPFDHRVGRFDEVLQIMAPLLREGYVDFSGTYYSAPNCELRPRGPRPDGPPILIGAFGPRMLQITARYANTWNTCWHGRVSSIAVNRAAVEAACRAAGRDPATLEITAGVMVACPARDGTAQEELNPDKTLFGSVEEVAAALREYEQAGVGHVICWLSELNAGGLAWFADVLHAYREMAA
jgi:alkanesulfonate monooxygenase SsuD/methylene tetrahydromethanopterin reductase-like flavin-dependent oxidoreductase (luciferase family)